MCLEIVKDATIEYEFLTMLGLYAEFEDLPLKTNLKSALKILLYQAKSFKIKKRETRFRTALVVSDCLTPLQ